MPCKILNNVDMGIEGVKGARRILGSIREEAEKRKEANP
jgi:hypothetical protein